MMFNYGISNYSRLSFRFLCQIITIRTHLQVTTNVEYSVKMIFILA